MNRKSDKYPSRNSILRMTEEQTIEFIELYEQEPCLWKTDDPHYRCHEKRQAAVTRIVKALGKEYFEEKHAAMKFKNLRNAYAQELKKIAKSIEQGRSGDGIHKPTLCWFKTMDRFLKPYMNRAGPVSRVESVASTSYFYTNIKGEINPDVSEEVANPLSDDDDANEESENSDNDSNYNSPLKKKFSEIKYNEEPEIYDKDYTTPAKKLKIEEIKINKTSENYDSGHSVTDEKKKFHDNIPTGTYHLIGPLSSINEKLTVMAENANDPYECFGKYIACTLKNLTKHRAMKLQTKLVGILAKHVESGND